MTRWWLVLLLLAAGREALAQNVQISVRAASTNEPLEGALVRSTQLGRVYRTDRAGQVRFEAPGRPDTLRIALIGFAPVTLPLDSAATALDVLLTPRPATLNEVSVFGQRDGLSPSGSGVWAVPRTLTEATPAAVEPDVLRSLALVPSVTFSSPLSARPNLRGYDANESVFRLDGFEIDQSLPHLARLRRHHARSDPGNGGDADRFGSGGRRHRGRRGGSPGSRR